MNTCDFNEELSGVAINDPYEFGCEQGRIWAEKANCELLSNVAARETTNEQIKAHLEFYLECEAVNNQTEILHISPPFDEDGDLAEEIRDYFRAIIAQYPCFQGEAKSFEDPEICAGNYYISDMPKAAFRRFEDGWVSSVRKHYRESLTPPS